MCVIERKESGLPGPALFAGDGWARFSTVSQGAFEGCSTNKTNEGGEIRHKVRKFVEVFSIFGHRWGPLRENGQPPFRKAARKGG